jgi:hypothetical protein
MPKVGNKKYPYTKSGIKAASAARKRKKTSSSWLTPNLLFESA